MDNNFEAERFPSKVVQLFSELQTLEGWDLDEDRINDALLVSYYGTHGDCSYKLFIGWDEGPGCFKVMWQCLDLVVEQTDLALLHMLEVLEKHIIALSYSFSSVEYHITQESILLICSYDHGLVHSEINQITVKRLGELAEEVKWCGLTHYEILKSLLSGSLSNDSLNNFEMLVLGEAVGTA